MFLRYDVCTCVKVFNFLFFFFKQKTAYEMRISDWSSDVCSSDLGPEGDGREDREHHRQQREGSVGLEFETRAGIEYQVADAARHMLEERPAHADAEDIAERVEAAAGLGEGVDEHRISLRPGRARGEPPPEQAGAGHRPSGPRSPVEDPTPHR